MVSLKFAVPCTSTRLKDHGAAAKGADWVTERLLVRGVSRSPAVTSPYCHALLDYHAVAFGYL